MRSLAIVVVLLSVACGPDLPKGFEEAERVEVIQGACSPVDPRSFQTDGARYSMSEEAGRVTITLRNAPFRCEQPLEAWVRRPAEDASPIGGGLSPRVLIQPKEMNPFDVPRCYCTYPVTVTIEGLSNSIFLEVFTRQDNVGGPDAPQKVALGN